MTLARMATATVLLLAIMCAGCGADPAKKADDELKLAQSWAATARMVAEAWARGDVTRTYAVDALEASRAALQKESERLASEPDVLASAPVDLVARFRALEDAVARMRAAVERGDRDALGAATNDL